MSFEKAFSDVCSAEGWWSCYFNGQTFWFERVVVFALSNDPLDDERRQVVGIDQVNLNERRNGMTKDSKWFKGYVHKDEFEVLGEKLCSSSENKMRNLEVSRSEEQQ